MAEPQDKKNPKSVLDALASGEPIEGAGRLPDPDAVHYHPAEDFAIAWLSYWRGIGNHVLADEKGCAFLCATMAGLEDKVPQEELAPHLRLWNNDMRAGAERAMEVMLRAVPGARDALRQIVGRRQQ